MSFHQKTRDCSGVFFFKTLQNFEMAVASHSPLKLVKYSNFILWFAAEAKGARFQKLDSMPSFK
jgi:hypothetical protein